MAVLIRCKGKDLKILPKNQNYFTKEEVQEILWTTFLKIEKVSKKFCIIFDDRPSPDVTFLNTQAKTLLENNGKSDVVYGDSLHLNDTEFYFTQD